MSDEHPSGKTAPLEPPLDLEEAEAIARAARSLLVRAEERMLAQEAEAATLVARLDAQAWELEEHKAAIGRLRAEHEAALTAATAAAQAERAALQTQNAALQAEHSVLRAELDRLHASRHHRLASAYWRLRRRLRLSPPQR